jgi:DNA transposition AAA+ family ATPase
VREPGDGGCERHQRAFDRAVAREREAIGAHDRAAAFHDATADVLAQAALGEPDAVRSAVMARRAANERRLADTARERARTARARLAAEGVTVDE